MISVTEIRQILENKYDRVTWKNFLSTHFTNNQMFVQEQPVAISDTVLSENCISLGNYEIDDFTKIGIFEIQLKTNVNIARNRVALRNLLKDITHQVSGAMVVFVQGEKWRFSYISKRKVKKQDSNEIIDKETAPKRYTYLFGKNEKALTASMRFEKLISKQKTNMFDLLSLDDFEEAFNVEKLGKEFFKDYKQIYEDFVLFLTGKKYEKKGNKYLEVVVSSPDKQLKSFFDEDDKQARDFVKRMMGRIIFLYFIQKKGWLAVKQGKKWGDGDQDYLYNLFKKASKNSSFYSDQLVKLFFDTLNNVDSENPENEFRFPYLNGGLFDDSQDLTYNNLKLPYHIFENLFETFNRYNFTVYEDLPDEHTVAVDPEMLGHIFENLLEDNKDKGAFYTPKEIVHYMCKESLKSYLLSHDDLAESPEEFVDKIIQQKELSNEEIRWAEKNAYKIQDALESVKICDPAIGSGAFPMGLLQEIFNTQIFLQEIKGFKKADTDAKIKKHIIEESIYGVDIDEGAVDIARLRFWLSLVVDEEKPHPLPNLDFKIICANSLNTIDVIRNNMYLYDLEIGLKKIRQKFFNASHDDKIALENEFYKLKDDLKDQREHGSEKERITIDRILEFDPFRDRSCSWFDPWWMFGITLGFDIIIGNPPYGAKLTKEEKALYKIVYSDVHMRTPDTFNYFISRSLRLLKDDGVLSFIVPNNLLFQGENAKTRSLLINNNKLRRVVNLGDNTFENADVPTCIFVVEKKSSDDYPIRYSDHRKDYVKEIEFFNYQKDIFRSEVLDVPDLVIGISGIHIKLFKDIELKSVRVDSIATEVASGISTGSDKIFRISKEVANSKKLEKEILKPVLVGGDIDKYHIKFDDNYLIYTARDTAIDEYPNTFKYLLEFRDKLTQRSESKQGILPWYALGRQRYPALFELPKIILRQTSDSIRATYDESGLFSLNSILILQLDNKEIFSYKYALICLNSKMNDLVYKNLTQEEGRTFAEVKPQNVRKLFIPKIPPAEQKVFERLCDYLLYLNDDDNEKISTRISNKTIAQLFQEVADACVVELIYGKEMERKNVNVLVYVRAVLKALEDQKIDFHQQITDLFANWIAPHSEVRNRLKLMSLKCPDTVGKILNPNEED